MSHTVSDDIDIAATWLHTAARKSNRREEVRLALSEALRLATEMHGTPSDDSFDGDEPTVTILARCLECWDEYERNARQEEWAEVANDPICAKVRDLGKPPYQDGSPKLEIWIPLSARERLPVIDGIRVLVRFWVGDREFQAGLRATKRNQYFQICPDMTDEIGKQTLGRVLTDAGFSPNAPVDLLVVGREIRLRLPTG